MRAEILNLNLKDVVAARIVIKAAPEKIFSYLADPRAHTLFDGSSTIQGRISGPDRLFLGARFGMAMKIRVPYRITNEVVAFKEDHLITWRHLMKWTWSYELIDLGDGTTQVTETFDASVCNKAQLWWVYKTDSLARNPKWMAKSLVKLKALCEA
ncbi:MAG: SRPBCC family protein [Candidatus Planktophila sp.]